MKLVTFTEADRHDPRLTEAEERYREAVKDGTYVIATGAFGSGETTYILTEHVQRVERDLLRQQAIQHLLDRQAARRPLPPNTVRNTALAAFEAMRRMQAAGVVVSEVAMHPALWEETLRQVPALAGLRFNSTRLFGIPVRVDPSMPFDTVTVGTAAEVKTFAAKEARC